MVRVQEGFTVGCDVTIGGVGVDPMWRRVVALGSGDDVVENGYWWNNGNVLYSSFILPWLNGT